MTPLMQASAKGDVSALKDCIRKGANLHHQGEGRRTCLTMATMAINALSNSCSMLAHIRTRQIEKE